MTSSTSSRWLKLLSLIFLSILTAGTAFAEEAAAAGGGEHTLWQTIKDGGPAIMLIWFFIIGTSVVMVTFIIQNAMTFKKDRLAPPPLVAALHQLISSGNYQEAWETCNANKNYLANVTKAALSRIGRGKDAVESALAEHGVREATVLRTRNSYLSVIGVVSPMIGLLGTVIGMIGAFAVMGTTGVSDPKLLAAKIGEVLIATASGLFIAIPAFVAYYIFRNVSQASIVFADDIVNELVTDIPFDELAGVQIGQNFSAEGTVPTGIPAAVSARPVAAGAAAAMTNCPICAGAISVGSTPCPHCGSVLSW